MTAGSYNLSLPTTTTTTQTDYSTSETTTTTTSAVSFPLPMGSRVCLGVVLLLTVLVGVWGNGMLCMLVYRKAAMRSAINLLVAHLALSDLLLSALVMPFAWLGLFLSRDWAWREEMCAVEMFAHDVLVTLNVCLLLSISMDRYLLIVHHQEKLSPPRTRVLILSVWVFSLLTAACPLLGWGRFSMYPGHPQCWDVMATGPSDLSFVVFRCVVTRYLPVAAILYSYLCLVSTVRQKNLKVAHYPLTVGVTRSSGSGPAVVPQPRVSVTCALRELSSSEPCSTSSFLTSPAVMNCAQPGDGGRTIDHCGHSVIQCCPPQPMVQCGHPVAEYGQAMVECGHPMAECGHPMAECAQDCVGVVSSLSSTSPVCFFPADKAIHLNCNGGHDLHPAASNEGNQQMSGFIVDSSSLVPSSRVSSTSNILSAPSNDAILNPSGTEQNSSVYPSSSESVPHADLHRSRPSFLAAATTTARAMTPQASSPCRFHSGRHMSSTDRRRLIADMNLKTRTFKTILILSLLLVVCLMPYVTAVVVSSWTHCPCPEVLCVLLWLEFLKSALNPLVYAARIHKFREAWRDLCPRVVWGLLSRCMEVLVVRRVDPGAVYQCAEQHV